MKSSTLKLHKSQRKTNYTWQNENSIDSLASNYHITSIHSTFVFMNKCSFIFETMPQVLLLLEKV